MTAVTTDAIWMLRLDPDEKPAPAPGPYTGPGPGLPARAGNGPRLAVKDCIDVAGTPTTAGSAAVAADAVVADLDAAVVATAREQGARIVGKTNLVELCRHADGVNPWSGTPTNPLDPERIPGGSSSGSAVAVATGQADVAYGTDTGGSVRVPAACCGVAGLKTTAGRIPTHGVFEFSRTLDTVGPMAQDVSGLVLGMRLMEPGFDAADAIHAVASTTARPSVARLRIPGVDPAIDTAIDAALAAAALTAADVVVPAWDEWWRAANLIMTAEGYYAHRHLLARADMLEPRHAEDIAEGRTVDRRRVSDARRLAMAARAELSAHLAVHGFLALPTLASVPPRRGEVAGTTRLTAPLNLAGLPAAAIPVPRPDGGFPASLQLVGPWYAEDRLLAFAARVEAAFG